MEFKVVDKERLNIYLTCAELKEEEFSDNVLSDPKALKRKLRHIFEKARLQTGFRIEDIPLEVEVIPILDGDLFISVRRLEEQYEFQMCHVIFYDFEPFISLCHELLSHAVGKTELYLYDGVYHFFVYTPKNDRYVSKLIYEFGIKAEEDSRHNVSRWVLKEHGTLLCEHNCVKKFTNIFEKGKKQGDI